MQRREEVSLEPDDKIEAGASFEEFQLCTCMESRETMINEEIFSFLLLYYLLLLLKQALERPSVLGVLGEKLQGSHRFPKIKPSDENLKIPFTTGRLFFSE